MDSAYQDDVPEVILPHLQSKPMDLGIKLSDVLFFPDSYIHITPKPLIQFPTSKTYRFPRNRYQLHPSGS